jgi:hypothetical protein
VRLGPSSPDSGSCVAPGQKCVQHTDCGKWKCECKDGKYPINSRWCKDQYCVLKLEACENVCGAGKVDKAEYLGCN